MSPQPSLKYSIFELLEENRSSFAMEVDDQHIIIAMEGTPHKNLPKLTKGKKLTDALPLFESLLTANNALQEELVLPFITIESAGVFNVSITLLKSGNTGILIENAEEVHTQYQENQQLCHQLILSSDAQKEMLRQLEEARQHIEKKNQELEKASQAKSLFIASMSHEFKTPMTSIIGYTSLLKRIVGEPPQAKEYIAAIERGSNHLLMLIDNLLDHAQIESNELDLFPQPISAEHLLKESYEILKPLAARKGLKFKLNILNTSPGDVLVDSVKLKQALLNVANNAINYTAQGCVTIRSNWTNNWLELSVEDSGTGIPLEAQETIFEPFFRIKSTHTSSQQGVGLGLFISKHLIERMGGELNYADNPGGGSIFTITIPAISVSEESSATKVSSENRTILIAEDDPDIRMLLEINLEQMGYSIISCTNGKDAVNITKSENPDIVLIDMHMPILDGLEATKRIRKSGYKNSIIALTAPSSRHSMLDAGCDDCIAKPLNMDELYTAIHQSLLYE